MTKLLKTSSKRGTYTFLFTLQESPMHAFRLGCAEFDRHSIDGVPAYWFIILAPAPAGTISLRLCKPSSDLERSAGHIGYEVESRRQGNHYASKAVRLLLPFAKKQGVEELWITVSPDNKASVRTCEIAGGELIETVDVPEDHYMWKRGEKRKHRFLWKL